MSEIFILDNFTKYGLPIDHQKARLLVNFYEMLIEKNKVMNLTSITDFKDVVLKHFLDSVYGGKFIQIEKGTSVADIGSGAGFPGIPLKICFPELQIVLIDSLNKRTEFLKDVIKELGLENIDVVHGRAEDLGRSPVYRERFQYVVSRAVADLSVLSEYCLPFLKVGGIFLSYKGGTVETELDHAKRAITVLGGDFVRLEKFSYSAGNIPGDFKTYTRSIVMIEKKIHMGEKYPRKAGIPEKSPLR